ncbi:transposase [Solimonas sp. K1W22B-7]|nr:transposase [Solimonas sp. K1W22B-7]
MDHSAESGNKALRLGRVSLSQHAYHLTFTVSDRAPVFNDLRLGRIVAQCLNSPALIGDASTLAWVLMPDHLHWLVQLGDQVILDKLVRRMKSESARLVNQQRGRAGALWQPGYYDHLIRDDENLRDVARYIVANPLRAGLVRRVGDYPLWDAIWL